MLTVLADVPETADLINVDDLAAFSNQLLFCTIVLDVIYKSICILTIAFYFYTIFAKWYMLTIVIMISSHFILNGCWVWNQARIVYIQWTYYYQVAWNTIKVREVKSTSLYNIVHNKLLLSLQPVQTLYLQSSYTNTRVVMWKLLRRKSNLQYPL